jgi:hypothetical protein
MKAAEGGHYEVTELLLKSGASVKSITMGGLTPAMLAAWRGQADTLHLLIQRGSNMGAITQVVWARVKRLCLVVSGGVWLYPALCRCVGTGRSARAAFCGQK